MCFLRIYWNFNQLEKVIGLSNSVELLNGIKTINTGNVDIHQSNISVKCAAIGTVSAQKKVEK